MTKQNVVAVGGEGIGIAVAAVPSSSPLHRYDHPYLPPRPAVSGSSATVRKKLAHLELGGGGGRINAWVDTMKASSPTHAKAASALGVAPTTAVDEEDDAMAVWTMKHPSALVMFDEITAKSAGKQIVMFLDYDGTLSPIVDDPDQAFMTGTMREAVKNAARYFPTAIVSGRCRDKVYNFVRLAELYYAGSHGMDIKGPAKPTRHAKTSKSKKGCIFQPASEFLPMIDDVYRTLTEMTKCVPGAKVENNKFCVSVHFRCVEEKKWSTLADQVRSVLHDYPMLRLTQGRKVLEIRPKIKWDKGRALEFLLESLGFADCSDVLPVYIGDDRTDEDAFKVLRERGQGLGIVVSKYPKETDASYSLQEPSEVMDFLHRLVEWKRVSKKSGMRIENYVLKLD